MKDSNKIQNTVYSIELSKLPYSFHGFKILQLSDLHSRIFNASNEILINLINESNPDIIVITGDMINSQKDDGSVFINIIKNLKHKYPVYFVLGNHEHQVKKLNDEVYSKYISELIRLKTIILDNFKISIKKGNDKINLWGLTLDPSFYWKATYKKDSNEIFPDYYIDKKLGPCAKKEVNILLVHNPKYFEKYSNWGADLIFSGHVHGGIIRLPYFGGFLSPDRSFFPKYDNGLYEDNGNKMIVSRGLGNSHLNLRINNKPELIVVTLKKG
jgi:predicted MPP superfamily phosphohydrolase